MKKYVMLTILSTALLSGCQSVKGTVTPTMDGYYVDAVGNHKNEARKNCFGYCEELL